MASSYSFVLAALALLALIASRFDYCLKQDCRLATRVVLRLDVGRTVKTVRTVPMFVSLACWSKGFHPERALAKCGIRVHVHRCIVVLAR